MNISLRVGVGYRQTMIRIGRTTYIKSCRFNVWAGLKMVDEKENLNRYPLYMDGRERDGNKKRRAKITALFFITGIWFYYRFLG